VGSTDGATLGSTLADAAGLPPGVGVQALTATTTMAARIGQRPRFMGQG
jgi:hypothetical protein